MKFTKAFLVSVVMVDHIGMAMVVVLFPSLFLEQHSILFSLSEPNATRLIYLGICMAAYPAGQFFGSSLFGRLSDKIGRKKTMFWTILLTSLVFLGSAVAIYFGSLTLLILTRLISGVCAGNVSVAQASLSDISTAETKAQNLSLAQFAMGFSYVVGPMFGATLADTSIVSWFHVYTPFIVFSLILLVQLFFLSAIYQDTLKVHSKKDVNVLLDIKHTFKILNNNHINAGLLVLFVIVSGWWLFESYLPTYLFAQYNLSNTSIAYFLTYNGAFYALFQCLVVQRCNDKMQPKNWVLSSVFVAGLAVILLSLVSLVSHVYLTMTFFLISMAFCLPNLFAIISNLVPKDKQGEIMGTMGSVQAVATILVMLVGGYIESINIHYTVIIGGLLIILSGILFRAMLYKRIAYHA